MSFSPETLEAIKAGRIRIGYLDYWTFKDKDMPAAQGGATYILLMALGAAAGGIAAGFLNELGKDLYVRVKEFLTRERAGIKSMGGELLRARTYDDAGLVCYAFLFEVDGYRIVVAYDAGDEDDLQFCLDNSEELIALELAKAFQNIPSDSRLLELDVHSVEISRWQRPEAPEPLHVEVSHKWVDETLDKLWLNNIVYVTPQRE